MNTMSMSLDRCLFWQLHAGIEALIAMGAKRKYMFDDGASYVARVYASDGSYFEETDLISHLSKITLHDRHGNLMAIAAMY